MNRSTFLHAAIALTAALICAPALADDVEFEAAREPYEQCHWQRAFAAFSRLADRGNTEAARIVAQMARYGGRLYGQTFTITPGRLARWQEAAGATAQARRLAAVPSSARPHERQAPGRPDGRCPHPDDLRVPRHAAPADAGHRRQPGLHRLRRQCRPDAGARAAYASRPSPLACRSVRRRCTGQNARPASHLVRVTPCPKLSI